MSPRRPGRGPAWAQPALALTFAACGQSPGSPLPPLEISPGCNPIAADVDCLLPFPSDVFLVPDPGLPSGKRLAIPAEAAVRTVDGEVVDFTLVHPSDGFSHLSPILALFPQGVAAADLATLADDPAKSLDPSSTTTLLEADTGARVLHFAETDPRASSDANRALLLHPLVKLRNEARYIVALRGLHSGDGAELAVPEGFRRIRDRETQGDPILAPIAERYEAEIFPQLEAAGVERNTLQLAWDFTTESETGVTRDMLAVRAQALAALATTAPTVTVDLVTNDLDRHIYRRIEAHLDVPLFLDGVDPGGRLLRDPEGVVVSGGIGEVPITIIVPRSVTDGSAVLAAGRVVQFGHGFFGDRGEIEGAAVAAFADRTQSIVIACDWWGMAEVDQLPIVDAVFNDISSALVFTDRIHQAMVNQISLTRAAKVSFAAVPELQVNGEPLYDASSVYFYGISNGHILGATLLPLAPEIERAALAMGGVGYSLIMFRATPFRTFLQYIEMVIPDPLDQQKFAALSQTSFDRIDPVSYAAHTLVDTYPGSPTTRQVLLQVGIGDSEVPNVASHLHARMLGIPQLAPESRPLLDIPARPGPQSSALAEYDLGIANPLPGTFADLSPESNGVHTAVRLLDAANDQISDFFAPGGVVVSHCDGVCDPE